YAAPPRFLSPGRRTKLVLDRLAGRPMWASDKERNCMNKSLITGVVAGVVIAGAAGAFAGYKMIDRQPDYAQVVDVKPVEKTISTPRQECHDESVSQQAP